jgi:hypothetical protein
MTMDEATALAAVKHYMDATDPDVAHEIYHDDAVLDFPQSGERFDGVETFKAWRRIYPAHVAYELRRFRGRDDFWVAELVLHYDGGPPYYGVSILEFRSDKVARETIYGGEAWEAPEWRAPYRSDTADAAAADGTT